MTRRIIRIDEEKCVGCGLCVHCCHNGALAMINGKAKLVREDCCDGACDCLPDCPRGAISVEECEAGPCNDASEMTEKEKSHRKGLFSALFKKGGKK